ncbi:molybdopterin synthase catalytic subunit MoaE [Neptunomonas japonica]|uniref:Molybdopterin synthase catalytic subunit n=1 Tax=Neptunomonas japonica JAMM 1380 TaxID=1441457 RepID=A0A7R6PUW7_9GAMM|nr:molybdopterin synthase catalytic subunit MoaE [Neptunomonas japonica]BBB29983.1 molybdopterin synthase catalytic subunit [Neptunomonas japonica JAMM 1380]
MSDQAAKNLIKVQAEDFSIGELYDRLKSNDASSGAVVTFTGIVREHVETQMQEMFLEHYPGMTERALEQIVEQARQRWQLGNVVVIHRIGRLSLNDNIVFVGVASGHRVNAFAAAQFIMDYLKKDAPFWKKEINAQSEAWVEQKSSDLDAANQW